MYFGKSSTGRARTLWEYLTGSNKWVDPPEYRYLPLSGSRLTITSKPGIEYSMGPVKELVTVANGKKYYHTNYNLRAGKNNFYLAYRDDLILFMTPFDEFEYDQGFMDNVLKGQDKDFVIYEDSDGKELETPIQFWRVDDVSNPYYAHDQNGESYRWWDYSRINTVTGLTEYLIVVMDNDGYTTIDLGEVILSSEIEVI